MIFFFSSRRRHTRYWRDWSSDVCSSDLYYNMPDEDSYLYLKNGYLSKYDGLQYIRLTRLGEYVLGKTAEYEFKKVAEESEIGRACVGKECRSRWSPYH